MRRLVVLVVLLTSLCACVHPALISPHRAVLQCDEPPVTNWRLSQPRVCRRVVPRWTTTEKVAAVFGVACAAGDVATTLYGREIAGLREANPAVRRYEVFIPLKLALLAGAWWIGEWTGQRTWTWSAIAVPNCAVTTWNAAQIGKAR